MRALFERLRKHNLRFSPSKARLGATDADFLDHSISPAGVRPSAEKKYPLTKMPTSMARGLKQVRALSRFRCVGVGLGEPHLRLMF